MSPFDDASVLDRLFTKLDHITDKIDDLCERMTKQETKYDLHIEGERSRAERKEKIFYGVLGMVGAIVSLVELARMGFIG